MNLGFDDNQLNKMYILDESFRELRSMINTYWSKNGVLGLGITHGILLSMIAEEGALKASYLADRLHITCGAVTGIADKLIELGLVVRKKDETDRRVVLLQLTDQGVAKAGEIKEIRKKLMLNLFANMTSQEMELGIALFDKLKMNMLEFEQQ